jgi:hypothetical protein
MIKMICFIFPNFKINIEENFLIVLIQIKGELFKLHKKDLILINM